MKVALLFPGQGSQYVGMGQDLCAEFPVAAQTYDEAEEVLGVNLRRLCFEGDLTELTKTENAQPAVLTLSIAMFRVYAQEVGIAPDFAAGHSMGEISALVSAEAITFSDALRLIRVRARVMQEMAREGSMAAVLGLGRNVVEEVCQSITAESNPIFVANYNSPTQFVISGSHQAVFIAATALEQHGGRVVPLKVSGPFHCPLMKEAAQRFNQELSNFTFNRCRWPVVSNLTALPYDESEQMTEYLVSQLTEPVRWQSSVEYLFRQGVNVAVELGPKAILKGLVKECGVVIETYAFSQKEERTTLFKVIKSNVKGASQDKGEIPDYSLRLIRKCLAEAVCTRNRNWNEVEYRRGVVEPYYRLKQLLENIEREGRGINEEEARFAIRMLYSILQTKGVSTDEQAERVNRVLTDSDVCQWFSDTALLADIRHG